MKLKRFMFFLATILAFSQCKPLQPEGEGIKGTITWLEGNQMPMISDSGETREKPKAVQRKVLIYPLLKFSDLKLNEGLFEPPRINPIAEVESDAQGKYSVSLSPGRYSVFTQEEGGLFAGIFDGEGNVMPVTVKEGQWTLLDIQVNYKAAF
ncbi:carboxypeptidase regulatory-like domain-containing protein [Algoriphagus mannitolivorans]|uniref:carboxypeptidase regulatory-like domain-containing protein n=1 Tax=Algoriphagus mannitolivorans TaxID=226504 RepID=UPI0012F938F3|nr:carboxypeptidase regulatory-like domain-containing protein [Algoriphagus mannitolivorans]